MNKLLLIHKQSYCNELIKRETKNIEFKLNIKKIEKQNLLIFSNCHRNYYKKIFEKYTNIPYLFNIKYIINYENLNNYENIKPYFEKADIIIINPILNYEKFKIENIKNIVKPTCKIIIIPFIRFDGFWMEKTFLHLLTFQSPIYIS
jgi:flagellar biosynthesis protein FlhB